MPSIPGSRGTGRPDLWQGPQHYQDENKEAWEELATYCPAAKQRLQQRSWGCTGRPGARDHDEGCCLPGGRTHRAGKVVHTTRAPRALIGRQPIKVQSKTTLRTRAATPVNRSKYLTHVWPLSQFSGLELRNRDGADPWMKDATTPQQTDMGTTLGPPKGISGSDMVNPHRQVGRPEEWRLPDTGST